jgi:hypothetical protein
MRLYGLLNKQEENQLRSLKEWVSREAANQDALQEAGTFRYSKSRKRMASRPWQGWTPFPAKETHQGLSF